LSGVGTHKAKINLTLLAVAVLGVALLYSLRSGEPFYQGKPLRSWLEQFGTNHWSVAHGDDLDRQAEAALQHLGTNAVPIYLQWLTSRESPFKVKLLTLSQESWLAPFHVPSLAEYRVQVDKRKTLGAYGFVALGAQAKPCVPALMDLYNDGDKRTRYLAVFALRCLGPAANAALPVMIACLKDAQADIRGEAATFLGEFQLQPEQSVRILMDFVEEHRAERINWFPNYDAIRSLAKFGAQARPAVPLLIALLNHPQQGIREAATNALKKIDPDAAANAGVK
jgi:hypothetical protein